MIFLSISAIILSLISIVLSLSNRKGIQALGQSQVAIIGYCQEIGDVINTKFKKMNFYLRQGVSKYARILFERRNPKKKSRKPFGKILGPAVNID